MPASQVHPVVVIGGGLNGLSTLFHLLRLGVRRPLLLERLQPGHDRGSSHGPTRIARSTYPQVGYVHLVRRALTEEWPRLQRAAGEPLLFPTPALFFGPPDGPLASYAHAVAAAGADVIRLDVQSARRQFPMLRFADSEEVLHDRTAAVIASSRTLRALERLARAGGAEVRTGTDVRAIDMRTDPIRIATDQGEVRAERLVVTAGPWTGRLLPFLAPRLLVVRQHLAYFDLECPRADHGVGRFPVFARLGALPDEFHYGLPEFDRAGVKVARHVVHGADDPDARISGSDDAAIADLRELMRRECVPAVRSVLGTDTCLYTCTRSEDFVLDVHPENARVVIGAACSGHGFKFGPLVGRILAELALSGDCTLPEFAAMRHRLRCRDAAAG